MTEPTPMSLAEVDRAIIDASRDYIAAVRSFPRDTERIDATRAALDDLIALRGQILAG